MIRKMSKQSSKASKAKQSDEYKVNLAEVIAGLDKYEDMIEDVGLRTAVKYLYQVNNAYFYKVRGSDTHHNYRHGLIQHTYEIVDYVYQLVSKYGLEEELQMDELLTIAMLYNIGRIVENKDELSEEEELELSLSNSRLRGAEMFMKADEVLHLKTDKERILRVKYGLLGYAGIDSCDEGMHQANTLESRLVQHAYKLTAYGNKLLMSSVG